MSDETLYCPVCERGTLSLDTGELRFKYRDRELVVPDAEYCRCDICDAEPILPDQFKRNDRRITAAKRRADGLLTGDEIARVRYHLAISQAEAAALFGGGTHAFSKYERGEVNQSVAMDRLTRATYAFPLLLEWLRIQAGLRVPSQRPSDSGYVGSSRINLDAANHPASIFPGKEDIYPLNGDSDNWKAA